MNEDSHAAFGNIVPRENPPILINTQLSVGCRTPTRPDQPFSTVSRDDLSRHKEQIKSPAWHESILRERDERMNSGLEPALDWEIAKKQLRDRQS
jgi:hypothetical protein